MRNTILDEITRYSRMADALELIESNLDPLPAEQRPIRAAIGYILAEDVSAGVDSPSVEASAMDGYAVLGDDIKQASNEEPVLLTVIGQAIAGKAWSGSVLPGTAVRITTGAPLPRDADTVVPIELSREPTQDRIEVLNAVEAGSHVRARGVDAAVGQLLAKKGRVLSPGLLAYLAAAGSDHLNVIRRPKVAIIAVGDEVVEPGKTLGPGQIFASNLVNLSTWLSRFNIDCTTRIVGDDVDELARAIDDAISSSDALLTTGAAWDSSRDFTIPALDALGWHQFFRRVRMAPGKGVAFGLYRSLPVFCLPGGPPASEMTFLELALPGILCLAGHSGPAFPLVPVCLAESVSGRRIEWTYFHHATLSSKKGVLLATPHHPTSRLKAIADAECLICIPDGVKAFEAGETVNAQILNWPFH
ncbi:MAG: molybdopterin molybdotransferase MoeA [Proteobacteria bacterium]|nr:molybdopterin molybdotransferase MoeA [Pseudomonadota bacterium]